MNNYRYEIKFPVKATIEMSWEENNKLSLKEVVEKFEKIWDELRNTFEYHLILDEIRNVDASVNFEFSETKRSIIVKVFKEKGNEIKLLGGEFPNE